MFLIFPQILFMVWFSFWPFGGAPQEEAVESGLKKTSLEIPKDPAQFELIRISLSKNLKEITLSIPSRYQVRDSRGRPLFSGGKMVGTRIRPNESGIQIGAQVFFDSPLTIETEGEGIKFDGKVYRHALKIWRQDAHKISVINEVPLEDYLKGVLSWEANPKWPIEALKAQAVASRTYALFKAIENKDNPAQMSKDVLSQVYGGKNSENPATDEAVRLTRGEVLTYNGKIFPAYFHSTCGGATTHAEYMWDIAPHPSLKGVKCLFCMDSKHYRWSAELTPSEIRLKLRKTGHSVSGVENIETADVDPSGRARQIMITQPDGKTVKIRSNDFRLWMDPVKFKSTLIESITQKDGRFIFKGRGWGHGVGLCQYGMKGLSDRGYTYEKILDYYYPESEIKNLS